MPLQTPSDGWNPEERMILKETILEMYRLLESPIDKFILIATYEASYSQTDLAAIFCVTQAAISKRLKRILEYLLNLKETGKL
mgnify:CR=1 FL=1